jgi:hypothetical protein
MYGPNSLTTSPYTQCHPDVLDIVKDFVLPVHLIVLNSPVITCLSWSTPHTDHLPKPTEPPPLHVNGLGCIPDLPWRRNPIINDGKAIENCFEKLTSAIQRAEAAFAPKHRPPADQLVFGIRYNWRTGWVGSGKSRGSSLWKPRSTACRGTWPIGWMSGGTNIGAIRWNPWTWGPVFMEGDITKGDRISIPSSPLASAGMTSSLRLKKRKSWPKAFRCFSQWTTLRTRQLSKSLMRWYAHTNMLVEQVNRY